MRRHLELGPFEVAEVLIGDIARELSLVRDVRPPRELKERVLVCEWLLQDQLLRTVDLRDNSIVRDSVDGGQRDRAVFLIARTFEVGAHPAHQRGLVDGVGQIDRALARLHVIHRSADRNRANTSGQHADKLAAEGFLCDEP